MHMFSIIWFQSCFAVSFTNDGTCWINYRLRINFPISFTHDWKHQWGVSPGLLSFEYLCMGADLQILYWEAHFSSIYNLFAVPLFFFSFFTLSCTHDDWCSLWSCRQKTTHLQLKRNVSPGYCSIIFVSIYLLWSCHILSSNLWAWEVLFHCRPGIFRFFIY